MRNNVIYIDYLDSYYDITKKRLPKWIKRLIYRIMNYLGVVLSKDNEIILISVENDKANGRMLKNLYRIMKKNNMRNVVCADRLLENKEFTSRLQKRNYNILDGSWLNKYLVEQIIKKISYIKNTAISNLEIALLIKEKNDYIENLILRISKECKLLNIITEDNRPFFSLENKLENEGIMINISTNKSKALKYSDIIINYDFSEKELLECKFDGILIQINKEKFLRRRGITVRE